MDIKNWERLEVSGGEAYMRFPTLDLPLEIMLGSTPDENFFVRVLPASPMWGFPEELVEQANKLFENNYYVQELLRGRTYQTDGDLHWAATSAFHDLKPLIEPFNPLVAALSGRGVYIES